MRNVTTGKAPHIFGPKRALVYRNVQNFKNISGQHTGDKERMSIMDPRLYYYKDSRLKRGSNSGAARPEGQRITYWATGASPKDRYTYSVHKNVHIYRAKVLGKLPVPGRPTNSDDSRARAYCTCSRCGWGLFGQFFLSSILSFLSPSLWETARYRLKYCLKGPLNPKQPTNQSLKVRGHTEK